VEYRLRSVQQRVFLIQSSFIHPSSLSLAIEKIVLTAVSIGTGFRGGEFIPLVFIGATASSSVSGFLGVSPSFAAACGISAAFGSAASVPLTLSVFVMEHFSSTLFLYALAANMAARFVLGKESGLFPNQKRT
jgi:H+/Cl- antiporter ClcA